MLYKNSIQRGLFAMGCILIVQGAVASFTVKGTNDDKSTSTSKYSLNNLNKYAHKSFSFSLMKSTMQLNSIQVMTQKSNTQNLELNTFLQYNKGNVTYVFPYKFKVKVPKFKTPSPINQ